MESATGPSLSLIDHISGIYRGGDAIGVTANSRGLNMTTRAFCLTIKNYLLVLLVAGSIAGGAYTAHWLHQSYKSFLPQFMVGKMNSFTPGQLVKPIALPGRVHTVHVGRAAATATVGVVGGSSGVVAAKKIAQTVQGAEQMVTRGAWNRVLSVFKVVRF